MVTIFSLFSVYRTVQQFDVRKQDPHTVQCHGSGGLEINSYCTQRFDGRASVEFRTADRKLVRKEVENIQIELKNYINTPCYFKTFR